MINEPGAGAKTEKLQATVQSCNSMPKYVSGYLLRAALQIAGCRGKTQREATWDTGLVTSPPIWPCIMQACVGVAES